MRILVTGGAGYIGSVVVSELVEFSDVTIWDNLYHGQDKVAEFLVSRGATFERRDLRDSLPDLTQFDAIIHLAAIVGAPECNKFPSIARKVNMHALAGLVDTMTKQHYEGRFVFASTCSNYGINEGWADEHTPLNPQSLYAETKVWGEEYIKKAFTYSEKPLWTYTILRFGTAHGLSPRMRFDLTVNQFALEFSRGECLEVYNLDAWRPYCHVLRIAESIELGIANDGVDGLFNVVAENKTKRMILDEVKEAVHVPSLKYTVKESPADPRNYRVRPTFYAGPYTQDTIRSIHRAYKNGLFQGKEWR